ncbi:uncharacterized protein FIESC28_01540 [Fusarium coffeatum]|uniref:Uncharacterized protein n=1 Tax=Fusarium coffeatum TaxID=231269 RepID=A0A366S8B7_9HYPO|nr:uncharacterized protein FIESC28_01540 [Fusarium coffeatum]RBR25577.1 hypothetical protein FIESC28_01540 [Fusarium coffeatum]
MSGIYQNERGQGMSHATGPSKVPESIAHQVPKGLEKSLPNSIHPTGTDMGQSPDKTHAKDDGNASMVPQKLQEKLPEGIERAVPNAIHDTGDTSGAHRKH